MRFLTLLIHAGVALVDVPLKGCSKNMQQTCRKSAEWKMALIIVTFKNFIRYA